MSEAVCSTQRRRGPRRSTSRAIAWMVSILRLTQSLWRHQKKSEGELTRKRTNSVIKDAMLSREDAERAVSVSTVAKKRF